MDKQLEQEANEYAERIAFRIPYDGSNDFYDTKVFEDCNAAYIAGATSSSTLLNFCHWIGKKGYKINGYDDGQLMTIINQFKTENNL